MSTERKVVLITGASGGIGSSIALAFAKSGYAVAACCHTNKTAADDVVQRIRCSGGTACAFQGDVSDEADVNRIFEEAEQTLGPINVLVNNAGISVFGLFTDLSLAVWEHVFKVNVTSMFLCCRRALPNMIHAKDGCIINIGSIWGEAGASCEAAYSASKAAVAGLTQALAQEEGPSGIRVNCIAPGLITTGMNSRLTSEEQEAFVQSTALCRAGTPEDVAGAAVFLAESRYITGQILRVDGGW